MEFVFLGLLVLAFPVIAIVALVKTVNTQRAAARAGAALRRARTRDWPARRPRAAPAPVAPAATAAPPRAAPARRGFDRNRQSRRPCRRSPRRIEPPSRRPRSRPSPSTSSSFEEQFGTRWTVWIGGVALALGGIFLVKYSIEAGLIGPGLRMFLGALLAAALVAGGEWARRQEKLSGLRRSADRAYSEHPHRRRHHRRLCHGLCRLRALWLPRSRVGLRAARRGGAGDARRGAAARRRRWRRSAWSAPM